jgi:predicted ferric reductase
VISRNPFSYSGSDQAQGGKLRFSIKEVGDFTFSVKDLKLGDRVYVDGPYGAFDLENPETKDGLVMVAGGIGLAPILSLLKTLGDTGDQRPLYLFYGDFSEKTQLYREELNEALERTNLKKLVIVFEKPGDEEYPHKGYITDKIMEANLPDNYKALYYFVCGPPGLVAAMHRNFKALDVSPKRIHIENYEMA